MRLTSVPRVVLLLLFCVPVACPRDAAAQKPGKRQFAAARAAQPPVVDGDLSDPAWEAAPEITGFTQHDPDDGKPATQATVVKVVFDEFSIYIGARMEDSRPITTLLGRRDSNLESDWFRINIDSQHDGINGSAFWVNPSNVQLDLNLYNDIYDDISWDAVWDSATTIVPGGWVAEVRIPFSQLRFPPRERQVWGINFARRTVSLNETARLVNTPKGETGFVSRFAELNGLDGIRPDRALELVPYGVSRSDMTSRLDVGDPFGRRVKYGLDGGLDVKFGLTSNVTLTGTLNPDFGQVEVDPAVVNLTEFETFYPEKRPFFTEGAQIFLFGEGPANSRWNFNLFPPNWFYSRRIGRSPQGSVDADYGDRPGDTTILGAAKISGKIGHGWSIGVLDALTDRERGSFSGCRDLDGDGVCDSDRWSQSVEPMTNYLVGRMTKEFGTDSRIGFLLTSTNRRLPGELSGLRENAYVLGVDGHTFFKGKEWLWEWLAGGSRVDGSAEAIGNTQTSPARYYDRPDADHLRYDPTRTSLTGFGVRTMVARQTGRWRPNIQLQTYSPGFEINDVGFMTRGDIINTHAVIHYLNQDVGKRLRSRSVWVGKYQAWNYGGDLLANGIHGNWELQAKNYWSVYGWGGWAAPRYDDRRTRGGPLVKLPTERVAGIGLMSDTRKKISLDSSVEVTKDTWGGSYLGTMVSLNYRPAPAVRLSLSPTWSTMVEKAQYVTTLADAAATETYGKRYVFAEMAQRTLDVGTRVEWTMSSRLSFQLYLQPFIASGGYKDFKQLARPRSEEYTPYGSSLSFDAGANAYVVSAGSNQLSFGNPDFNFRSVRGSAVMRWEFRPGSALYVVWNENRAETVPLGDFRLRRDFAAIPNALSRDVFLVKISYWLPM